MGIRCLYRISLDVYKRILDQDLDYCNQLKELNDVYHQRYRSLLKDENTSRNSIIDYVSQSTQYNREQKRKAEQDCQDSSLSKYQKAANEEQSTTPDYHNRMKFVEKFRADRAEEDLMMNWELCLLEGRERMKWKDEIGALFARRKRKAEEGKTMSWGALLTRRKKKAEEGKTMRRELCLLEGREKLKKIR